MAQNPIPITLIRWTSTAAAERLQRFVFGGMYALPRAPRGIDPEFISFWVRENVPPTSGPHAVSQVLELLRFYERTDLLAHLSRFLTRGETDVKSLTRSLHVTQCIGELGTAEQTRAASNYYAEFLVPHPEAMTVFQLVLDTAESLAATVDAGGVGRRLQAAIDAASKVPNIKGTAGIPFRKYSDFARNNYVATQRNVEARRRLIAAAPAQRLQELIFIYLGESPLSGPAMEVFAARLIRAFAMNEGQATVNTAFSQVIDATAKSQFATPRKEFVIHRAAQAILYLQGMLTFPQETVYEAIKAGPANFLWDDLGAPR
jgi:hypothetical protein